MTQLSKYFLGGPLYIHTHVCPSFLLHFIYSFYCYQSVVTEPLLYVCERVCFRGLTLPRAWPLPEFSGNLRARAIRSRSLSLPLPNTHMRTAPSPENTRRRTRFALCRLKTLGMSSSFLNSTVRRYTTLPMPQRAACADTYGSLSQIYNTHRIICEGTLCSCHSHYDWDSWYPIYYHNKDRGSILFFMDLYLCMWEMQLTTRALDCE